MLQQIAFQVVLFIIPLIIAVTFHEFAHIAMAKFLGDDLGTRMGRFSLDPLRHIDPIWTVALPSALIAMSILSGAGSMPLIAAGKPSPYNPSALKRRFWGKAISLRHAELLVALAGPLANLLLAFIAMYVVYFFASKGQNDFSAYSPLNLLVQFTYLNASLFVFNLIPIPPLDGTKILTAFLPFETARRYEAVTAQFSMVLFAILIFGGSAFIGRLVHTVVGGITWLLMH